MIQQTEHLESKIKRLERDLELKLSDACRAETIRVLGLLRAEVEEMRSTAG